ncbi:MAG: hypothetical protein JW791_01980 [Nanoarchaeota archaeon]|nr:hypothetical protein [Nanoarchaeota archaeon]
MRKLFLVFLVLTCFSIAYSADSIIIGVRQVGEEFEGVIATLNVEVMEGSNHVYMDTLPLTEIDTQASARLAREVACETMSVDCSDKDFFYTVRGEFPMIGGPSAGAAMTVLSMAELSGAIINSNVAMTGTVNPDGSVGNIGGLLEKAVAASKYGITTFLVPQGQLAEVSDYEFENGMRVFEVSTVREAYGYFTNNFFEELDDVIYFDEFNDFMKPLSDYLMNYSNTLFNDLNSFYEISSLTPEDSAIIDILINNTLNQRVETLELYNNNSYYSAASYAVTSSINSLYTTYLINYFEKNDTAYLNELLYFLNQSLNDFEETINQPFTLNHINDLEAVNIAVDRFFEAKQLYNEAVEYYKQDDIFSAFYDVAFTYVRLETSRSWLTLKEAFTDELHVEFNQELLKELALSRIENANTMITYAESVDYSTYSVIATNHLDTSRQAYNEGNYIYSLFESLRALSNANLAMQLRGITLEQVSGRIELSKKQARQNINLVQSNDLMPIMALSYYEYSETFEEDSPAQSLTFLEYSKQFSLLSIQMVNSIESSITVPLFNNLNPQEVGYNFTIVGIGLVIGVMLVLLVSYRLLL